MSARWTEWAWKQDLRPKSKLLLLAIADQLSDTGVAVLDLGDLARRARINSTVEVHRVLKGIVGGSAEKKGDDKMVVRLDAESAIAKSEAKVADSATLAKAESAYIPPNRGYLAESEAESAKAESASKSAIAESENYSSNRGWGESQELLDFKETLARGIAEWRRNRR